MNTKKDTMDLVDELTNSITYMQTLLGAAQDKLQFYLSNGPQLGPYRELLAQHAAETGTLLSFMERLLEKMEQEIDTVTGLLYAIEPSGAAQ